MRNTSLLQPDERLDLLIRLLSFRNDIRVIGDLRTELLSDISAVESMMRAASRRHLQSAAVYQLAKKGILPPARAAKMKNGSVLSLMSGLDEQFRQRRTALTNALHDVIEALNEAGVQPLVLKGSMSLISGTPEWRFQRDIDFAVEPEAANITVTALKACGFRVREDMEQRPHHLKPMQRDDVPGLIEPHVKLAGDRAREVLPDGILLGTVREKRWQGFEYRAMSDSGFLLHGLAHHYFQNRGFIYGTVSLKGLLEFADTITALREADMDELNSLVAGLPRLRTGLQLWCALARRLLGAVPSARIPAHPAVDKHAAIVSDRYQHGRTVSPAKGVLEHIALTVLQAPAMSLLSTVVPPVRDGCHRAVWRNHEVQRRNASGITADG